MEVGQPDTDGYELGYEGDQGGQGEIAGAEPAPAPSVALQAWPAKATVGDGADAHAHLLADEGHREEHRDERHEKPEPVLRAVGGVSDHARPVVLPEHGKDPGAGEQPQQLPALGVPASLMNARAVSRPRGVLLGQRRLRRGDVPRWERWGSDGHWLASTLMAAVTGASSRCSPDGDWTVTAPPGRTSLTSRMSPSAMPWPVRKRRTPGSRSETRTTRPRWPVRSEPRSRLGVSATWPSRVGMGSPCGSVCGSPSLAAITSHSPGERACSSASASSWTLSQDSPRVSARNASRMRCRRTPPSAARRPASLSRTPREAKEPTNP